MSDPGAIDHRSIAVLGLITICAYGSWYYAFGVLLDPIRLDTGWRESTLAASFSVGTILIGLGSLAGGRLLDRVGHRPVFALAIGVGSTAFVIASFADNVALFFVAAATGLGAYGALGFYHVTMATAVRLNPARSERAIAELTVWGAFASAIFLPLTQGLVDALEWRVTVRVLASITTAAFVLGAAVLPRIEPDDATERPSLRLVLASTINRPAPRMFTIAVALGGVAMSTMLVYQVPVMTAAGLGAGAAATMAGVRGFCQLGGRLPLTRIVARLGSNGALRLAFAAMALGGVLLAVSSNVAIAVAFALAAGFGIGAFSPLQGIKADELFDRRALGATMGFYGAALLLAGSVGPVTAGVVAEQTGERRWAALIIVAAALAAAFAVTGLARSEGARAP